MVTSVPSPRRRSRQAARDLLGPGEQRLVGVRLAPLPVEPLESCLRLIDPPAIAPLWLQYLLLAALPALGGYGARRVLATRLSSAE
jgi:hypothetical protein